MTDFSNTPNPADTESSMFAAVPAWERNKKRGVFGRSARRTESAIADEPRSFAPADPMASIKPSVGKMKSVFFSGACRGGHAEGVQPPVS